MTKKTWWRWARVPWRREGRGEQGAVSVLVVMCIPALILVLGLVVDTAGKNDERDRTAWTAEQAARAAAEQIDLGAVREGQPTGYDLGAAQAAAQRVLSVAGMTGTMRLTDDGQVAVTATSQYQPVILLMIGHGVTQTATVRVAQGIGDQEWP